VNRVGACVLVLALGVACRPEGVTLVSEADLPADVYGSPRPTPSPSPQEIPAEGTIFLVKDGRLRPQTVQLLPVDTLQEALLFALIGARPQGRNVTSEIPPRTRLLEIEVDGTVATVNLSSEFEAGSGQSLALRIAQVVYTLTEQPSGILGVSFEIDGVPAPVTEPDHPVSRADYGEFAPQGSA
jgi:sporulation and spore germination protein